MSMQPDGVQNVLVFYLLSVEQTESLHQRDYRSQCNNNDNLDYY